MKTKAAIWTFAKPSADSIIASHRIARFLHKLTKIPIVYDATGPYKRLDTLLIVNGAYAFCKHLPVLAKAVRTAQRIVWIQNDYTIVPPRFTSEGDSPFRAAFRIRHDHGLPPMELWSTCEAHKFSEGWGRRRYVNWNQLVYDPLPWRKREGPARPGTQAQLLYYGSYRNMRQESFDQYFRKPGVPTVVSSPSPKFAERYRRIEVRPAFAGDLREELRNFGLGLYIEDKRSHKEYHSPANRFYEMLSAHLPMVFDKPTQRQLARAELDVSPWAVRDAADIRYCMRHRDELRVEQHKDFGGCDYKAELRDRVKKLLRREGLL